MMPFQFILDAVPDVGIATSSPAWGAAIIFGALAIAVIAFKILRRSLKIAFRIVVLVMVLIVAALASVGVYVYKLVNAPKSQKPAQTQRQK